MGSSAGSPGSDNPEPQGCIWTILALATLFKASCKDDIRQPEPESAGV